MFVAYNDPNIGNERITSTKPKVSLFPQEFQIFVFFFSFLKVQSPPDEEQVSSSTTNKPTKPVLKRSRTPELPSPNDVLDEDDQPTTRQYNFSMSVDELSDMEKEVNDFCNEDDDDDDDDDDSNDLESRPTKQQRTSAFTPITTTDNPTNDEEEAYNSDSSGSQKLRELILGKKRDTDSDEESLSDDDAPRGWLKNQKTKKRQ